MCCFYVQPATGPGRLRVRREWGEWTWGGETGCTQWPQAGRCLPVSQGHEGHGQGLKGHSWKTMKSYRYMSELRRRNRMYAMTPSWLTSSGRSRSWSCSRFKRQVYEKLCEWTEGGEAGCTQWPQAGWRLQVSQGHGHVQGLNGHSWKAM
jgi:hypothetical protein